MADSYLSIAAIATLVAAWDGWEPQEADMEVVLVEAISQCRVHRHR